MNVKLSLVVLASLTLALGCSPEADDGPEPVGSSEDAILGGKADTGHSSVALLRVFTSDTSFNYCTGTVIAPRVILTAGHCAFANGQRLAKTDVSFADAPDTSGSFGAAGFTTGTIYPSPKWDGTFGKGHDLSVVILDAPLKKAAIALAKAPRVGDDITAVGYGRSTQAKDNNEGIGVKRKVTIEVSAVDAHEITAGKDGKATCHGDSGGPVFVKNRIVGTVSYGIDDATRDCTGASHFTRVDDNLDFIQPFLDMDDKAKAPPAMQAPVAQNPPQAGRSCQTSVQCINDVCTCGGSGAKAGRSCDGRVGAANSCLDVCLDCR